MKGEIRELPEECHAIVLHRFKFRRLEGGISLPSTFLSPIDQEESIEKKEEAKGSIEIKREEGRGDEGGELLDELPFELREMVLVFLVESKDWKSIDRASRTNWRWRNEIEFLWKKFAQRSSLLEDEATWSEYGKGWKWLSACVLNGIAADQPRIGFGKTIRIANEAQYEGEFNDSGKKHGIGKMRWHNGDRFIGSWKEDGKEGSGTMLWENGDSYAGGWKSDLRDGFSTYIYANGGHFRGYYSNDERHGEGVYTWPDGDRFEGTWVLGGRKGMGTFVTKEGERIQQEWNENPFVSYSSSLPSKLADNVTIVSA
eukprot:TRINITY_DN7097_c0_g1_i1.p1 TRINITY_DN7097_c0_g1~~TRINITY_DN7097_c0_g1_i1.p1  ORF type:complete len:314 (-),score=132.22 TRINITY_DN7097_c0_g1_i1:142-1083(-)